MVIGILSDNHGQPEPIRQAADVFEAHNVDAVVHCGDIGDLASLRPLVGRRIWIVWGNTDCVSPRMRQLAKTLGVNWPESVPVRFDLAERRVAVFHGHEPGFAQACRSGEFDYILHGHTHVRCDRRCGRTRIINPGALHRSNAKSIAVLNIETDILQFFTIRQRL